MSMSPTRYDYHTVLTFKIQKKIYAMQQPQAAVSNHSRKFLILFKTVVTCHIKYGLGFLCFLPFRVVVVYF